MLPLLLLHFRGVLGGRNNTLTKLEYRSSDGALASCVDVHIHDRGSLNTGSPRGPHEAPLVVGNDGTCWQFQLLPLLMVGGEDSLGT
ncbi:hypothetical protein ACHAWU_007244 [Discostella pseudostelligera]|uniref:Secreted protein n=1 Tax=Discostella pseudostelligera TaxID=259834 RepID=A0ABD3M0D0_9STRA